MVWGARAMIPDGGMSPSRATFAPRHQEEASNPRHRNAEEEKEKAHEKAEDSLEGEVKGKTRACRGEETPVIR